MTNPVKTKFDLVIMHDDEEIESFPIHEDTGQMDVEGSLVEYRYLNQKYLEELFDAIRHSLTMHHARKEARRLSAGK